MYKIDKLVDTKWNRFVHRRNCSGPRNNPNVSFEIDIILRIYMYVYAVVASVSFFTLEGQMNMFGSDMKTSL